MFSFNSNATSGDSKGGLFGSAGGANPSAPSGGGLFGNVGATTTSGSSTPLFGNAGAAAANSNASPFSFGAANKPATTGQSTPLFGSNASSTPNKTTETPSSGQTATSGLFGNNNASKPLFGNTTATPAQQGGGLFGNASSTTPAGPPPATTGQTPSLFGGAQPAQKPANSLFGNLNQAPAASTTPAATTATNSAATTATAAPSLFGNANATQPQTTGGGLFGSNPAQKPLFNAAPSATTGGGLFGNANKDKPAEPTTTTPATNTADNAPKSLFGNAAPAGGAAPAFKPLGGADATKPAFPSLGAPTTSTTSSTTPAASSSTPQKSLFPTLGGATSSATPSTTPATSGGGLFNLGGAAATSTTTTTPSTTATAAPTTTQSATPATGGLFGKPAATQPSTQPATASATTTSDKPAPSATMPAAGATGLGASTAGPTPPAQSRLKNKTMDEIITRWATDLTKYQKDFREQAEKVAEWDRMLVENGTKVQKLYGSTVDAERATQEVERQLASVEGQQDELSSWLDRYEREVDEMMSKQVGPHEPLQGPDQERERTYKTAERLSERLDEMGKDLTSMIEEVNSASATLSKTSKADEPISQIVRILNSHLAQLQTIDQGTTELQQKVNEAQRAGQTLSSRFGYGGLGNSSLGGGSSAVDDFYRSYMGRR
ncbi:putative nucleoporin Nsp1 [Aspergillus saccharolyticus JOP 1030-1]|uniref:Nucleoporin NSP1 n=1 Tax=Aspergillus saccharolyticus JOP 1030-1 TaxID=1450539 RepID=A0A318Z0U3_9EURO|nr:hypothetical protein BP01DRAFT_191700 [Aspergillus saccharolyticus JOP 1030-1]PYH40911.1 hypothetical protein BP01DRAFT_191700 [Aspergillus saccharolyticus JOP 1030-1]